MIIVWRIKRKIIRTVLCCVVYDSAQWYAHTCEQFLKMYVGLGLYLVIVRLFRFSIFVFSCSAERLFCSCVVCLCCVMLSFFSTKSRDWLGRTSPKWPILCPMGRKTVTQSIAYYATFVCVIMTIISCILVRKHHCVLTSEVKDYAYYCLMLRHFLMTSLYELNRCVLTLQLNDCEQHLYVTLSLSCVVRHFPHRAAWSFTFRSRIFRSCVFQSILSDGTERVCE